MPTLSNVKAWWDSLDSEWQKLLLDAIEADGQFPTEPELEEILGLKTIFMNVPSDDDYEDTEMFEIRTLAPLRMLTRLESLTIQGKVTGIDSLDPIKDCLSLKHLSIHGTNVKELSAVRALINLESISINRSKITDLSPLTNLPRLRSVNAMESAVNSLQPLSGKRKLTSINIWGPALDQQAIDQFVQNNPHCDVNAFQFAMEELSRSNGQITSDYWDEGDYGRDEMLLDDETADMEYIYHLIENGLNEQIAAEMGLGDGYEYRVNLEIESMVYTVTFDYIGRRAKVLRIECTEWEYDIRNDVR